MKAAFISRHGGNEVLAVGTLPDPAPGPGEVLVRIGAAALNRLDVFVRNGIPGVPVAFPHVPGADGCGVVESAGAGVKGLAEGDRVVLQPGLACGSCEFCRDGETSLCVEYGILGEHRAGTLAEKVVVPARNAWKAPAHLTDDGVLVLEIGHERAHFERAFPRLEVTWLPTSAGDDQVLLVTRDALTLWSRR